MEKRPLPLTIIGWFLILGGLFGAYSALTMGSNEVALRMMEDSGMSLRFQQALAVIGAAVALVSAYGIFKGLPWSRVLYVGWSTVAIVIGLLTSPFKGMMLLSVLFVAVIAIVVWFPYARNKTAPVLTKSAAIPPQAPTVEIRLRRPQPISAG